MHSEFYEDTFKILDINLSLLKDRRVVFVKKYNASSFDKTGSTIRFDSKNINFESLSVKQKKIKIIALKEILKRKRKNFP